METNGLTADGKDAILSETDEMLLQRNSELELSEPRYSGGLLYIYARG
jgi:hypothetical protein